MILYLTLLLFLINFIFFFKFFSHLNFFLIFLFVSQDFFGWYPLENIQLLKYKGDFLMVTTFLYLIKNIKDEMLEKIFFTLKPFYISYFLMFSVYILSYYFDIYKLDKNLLASRVLIYMPMILTSIIFCLTKIYKSVFFLKYYDKILLSISLIILVLNYIILINPFHTQFFNSEITVVRFDQVRILEGGTISIILILLSKNLIINKSKGFGISNLYFYLTIISNYILIGLIGQGRTLFVGTTMALVFSNFLGKKIVQGLFFLLIIIFFITTYSDLLFLSLEEFSLQEGNARFRLELFSYISESLKENLFFGIGIQNTDCSTCIKLPLNDIGIFKEFYYYGLVGTVIMLVGVILTLNKCYQFRSNSNFTDFFVSVCIYFIVALPAISYLTRIDLVLILGTLFSFLMLESSVFNNSKTKNK